MRVLFLAVASMGFGSAVTLAITKPPIIFAVIKFVAGLFSGALHAL